MNTHIPTIHDLNRKSVGELRVMFRNAANLAASAQRPECERKAMHGLGKLIQVIGQPGLAQLAE